MKDTLLRVINELKKKFGDDIILTGKELSGLKIDRISTGSIWLDFIMEGGLPRGRIVEIYGVYSAGKSLIAQRTVAQAQKQGLDCVWIDAEGCFDPKFAVKLGVDTDKLTVVKISEAEKAFDIVAKFLEAKPAIIVIDSVASLVPFFEIENETDQNTMALQARIMSKGLRKITGQVGKANTLVIFINQIREKIGGYGPSETVSGGRALGFYSSIRIEVRRGEWITLKDIGQGETLDEKKRKVGQVIKFNVTKSKVSKPHQIGSFRFFFNGIIDEADEIIALLEYTKKIERKGAYYIIGKDKYQGRINFRKEIRKNKELKEKLIKILREKEDEKD